MTLYIYNLLRKSTSRIVYDRKFCFIDALKKVLVLVVLFSMRKNGNTYEIIVGVILLRSILFVFYSFFFKVSKK